MFDQKRFRSCSFTNIHQYHVPVITWFIFYFIKSIRPLLTKTSGLFIRTDPNWPKMGSNQSASADGNPFGVMFAIFELVGPYTFIRLDHPLWLRKKIVPKSSNSGTKSFWNSNFGLAEWNGMNLNKLGNDYFKTCELGPLVRLTFSDL